MKNLIVRAVFAVALAAWSARAAEVEKANRANLAGVDHLGRTLATYEETGPEKKGRQIGLFYYLWLGQHGTRGPWDVTKMLEKDPDVFNKPDSPLWPDMSRTPILHWGEPLWGYYLSTDEWVLRRQVEMFIQAGVDVLYFDTTNGYHYREVTDKLFAILQEYHDRGYKAPKFCYYMAPARRGCGTSNVLDVWLNYYKDRKFSDLYFMWDGKPLIITHPDRSYRQEIWDFFTFRRPTWGCPERPDTWYWSGMPKPGVAVSSKGVREMLPVTVATPHVAPESADKENAGWNLGSQEANWRDDMQSRSCRSDLGGKRDTRPNAAHYGIFFQEQIDWALAKEREDVPLAFICQWNEWVSPTLTKPTNDMFGRMPHWLIMMDECSMEASRDIEPMKGGYRDAYYFQMMSFIRRWKGLPAPAKATCSYDFAADDLDAWAKVSPAYEEMTGDCAPRNHPGFDNVGVYTNYTGRNEFKLLKVAVKKDAVAFYAETVKPLTAETDPHWMELFVKVPGAKTDAMGFTHRICKDTKGVACTHRGIRIVYTVPAKLLGVDVTRAFQLEFKWSDNRQADDVMDFYVNGDAAPRGRLNWLFDYAPETQTEMKEVGR